MGKDGEGKRGSLFPSPYQCVCVHGFEGSAPYKTWQKFLNDKGKSPKIVSSPKKIVAHLKLCTLNYIFSWLGANHGLGMRERGNIEREGGRRPAWRKRKTRGRESERDMSLGETALYFPPFPLFSGLLKKEEGKYDHVGIPVCGER